MSQSRQIVLGNGSYCIIGLYTTCSIGAFLQAHLVKGVKSVLDYYVHIVALYCIEETKFACTGKLLASFCWGVLLALSIMLLRLR